MKLSYQLKVESCRSLPSPQPACGVQPFTCDRRAALTLLEMMVAVTLLAVIMVGLLAMFQFTQRALHIAHTQTDVFENARAAVQLVSRDLSELADYGDSNVLNVAVTLYASPVNTLQPPEPSSPAVRVSFDEAFWLTRVNDMWQGIGYYVDATNSGVGTLYRFVETTNTAAARSLWNRFVNSTNTHRVSDGVVHFYMAAIYVTNGFTSANPKQRFERDGNDFRFPLDQSNTLPAFIDFEIGVLEPATLKQFRAINSINPGRAQTFLQDHVGKIHFFRERVPIRNFINPFRADELL